MTDTEGDTVTDLKQLLTQYRDMKVELAYPLEQLSALEKKIKGHVRETGEVADIDGAKIIVTPPKKARVTWNSAGLDGFMVEYPEIEQFRTERWAAPSVRIAVK